MSRCATCHGSDADGKSKTGKNLYPRASDLRSPRNHHIYLCRILCLLIGPFLANISHADSLAGPRSEPYVWRNITIVAGGFMPGIEFDPAQAGLAYIRADIGGAYRWDQQRKTWVPLIDWAGIANWNDFGSESLAVDPSDANRVYVAAGTYTSASAGNASMLRSSDQGRTWQFTATAAPETGVERLP